MRTKWPRVQPDASDPLRYEPRIWAGCHWDVAASRDLSDEEIKPVLRLKHHEIGEFTEKHGVNLEWLLEGKGRVFEKDPITLNPKMTAAELAAVVRTLPEAKQQTIEAAVDRLLKERGL